MLHTVAFVVIGLVIGAIFIRRSKAQSAIIRVLGGLIGAIAGGFITLAVLGTATTSGKYGSLVVAVLLAVIIAGLASMATRSDLR